MAFLLIFLLQIQPATPCQWPGTLAQAYLDYNLDGQKNWGPINDEPYLYDANLRITGLDGLVYYTKADHQGIGRWATPPNPEPELFEIAAKIHGLWFTSPTKVNCNIRPLPHAIPAPLLFFPLIAGD